VRVTECFWELLSFWGWSSGGGRITRDACTLNCVAVRLNNSFPPVVMQWLCGASGTCQLHKLAFPGECLALYRLEGGSHLEQVPPLAKFRIRHLALSSLYKSVTPFLVHPRANLRRRARCPASEAACVLVCPSIPSHLRRSRSRPILTRPSLGPVSIACFRTVPAKGQHPHGAAPTGPIA
jgi:hypothetical protein